MAKRRAQHEIGEIPPVEMRMQSGRSVNDLTGISPLFPDADAAESFDDFPHT
jgi:hypothetical protein